MTATDPRGLSATQSFDVTIKVNQSPAAVGTISDRSVKVGGEVSVDDVSSYFSDPDRDALTYTATSSDPSLATVSVSGSTVTVTGVAEGSATIAVTATDPGGLSATQSFDVTIQVNQSPVAVGTISARSVHVGDEVSVDDVSPYFSDPDSDVLTYTAASSDPSLATVSVSGSTVTVTGVAEGSLTITVTAMDPGGLDASHSLDVTVTVPNRAPMAIGTISDISVNAGETSTVDVASNFTDPDGDNLSFAASSSNIAAATVTISGSVATVSAVAAGLATIIVTATDPGGLEASHSFEVTVTEPGFNIELYFTETVSASARMVIEAASSHWESILAGTEADDRTYDRPLTCDGITLTPNPTKTIDDLLILVDSRPIDGPGGTAAFAGPCWIRSSTNFPIYGAIVFDSDQIDALPETTGLYDVALHEIAHVLGIGTLWYVTNPSSDVGPEMDADTHFPGAEAVSAFNSAGGSGYLDGKVPVENGGDNSHWRHSVFPDELMAPVIFVNHSSPLSAISIQVLADLGYTVDASLADAYTVSVSTDPPLGEVVEDLGPATYLGNDVPRTPITFVDEDDRVVRVIVPR